VSAAIGGKLNQLADTFSSGNGEGADPGLTAGNVAANIIAGGIGGLVGGNSGAFAAANADLYNRDDHNADGKGGTKSEFLDSVNSVVDSVKGWAKDTYGDIPGDLKRWGNQLTGQMNADAQNKASEPPPALAAQGINNGVTAVTGLKGGEPPTASTGAVVVDSGAVNAGAVGVPGYVPDNATLANGDGDTPTVDTGKQGKHQPDHNNFIPGRSELTHPDPQQLVDDHVGTGQPANNVPAGQPGYRERVDFGSIIGNYVDPVTGEKTPTTNGIIHYSKDGVHIVPGRPQ
jgi:hypothetical protein